MLLHCEEVRFRICVRTRYLIGADIDSLKRIFESVNLERHRRGKSDLTAVVVESDWPEYEPVWKMIESRVNMGNQHQAIKLNEGMDREDLIGIINSYADTIEMTAKSKLAQANS